MQYNFGCGYVIMEAGNKMAKCCRACRVVGNVLFRRLLNESAYKMDTHAQSSNFVPDKRTESLLRGVVDGQRAKLAEAITLGT